MMIGSRIIIIVYSSARTNSKPLITFKPSFLLLLFSGFFTPANDLLCDLVVWRFLGDDDVVRVAFDQAGVGDLDQLGLRAQVLQGRGTRIAHAGAQAADQLVDEVVQWPFIWNAPLD